MKKTRTPVGLAGVCLIALQTACGGGARSPVIPSQIVPPPSQQSHGPADPRPVGTWAGAVGGSLGPESLTMTMEADSKVWFEGTGKYCRADGRWGVPGTVFTAWGSDCTGTFVTMRSEE